MTTAVTLVVPCYNEADRFPADRFADGLQRQANLTLLLVNDGSRDGTLDDLNRELARQLRSGTRDECDAAMMAHLEATTADKIAIANPKWR